MDGEVNYTSWSQLATGVKMCPNTVVQPLRGIIRWLVYARRTHLGNQRGIDLWLMEVILICKDELGLGLG
jgi:hypothetical protein